MPKAWLRERWETFIPALEKLTVAEQGEIARLCEQEMAYFHERFANAAPSSLGEPMSDTRVRLREIPLTETNSYVNDAGEREHIARKYMNWSQEEWRRIKKPSAASVRKREDHMRFLEEPEQIVAVATELLTSKQWAEVVIGLAALTGRRLGEILQSGEIHPKSLYSITFKGHLKNKKLGLRAYEIPVLCEASKVLSAWSRVRRIVDCRKMEEDLISKTFGGDVSEAANRHFAALVPPIYGDTGLSSKTMRKVYARLAVFFLCPRETNELAFFPTVLGHYWEDENGEDQLNVQTSVAYTDYDIGDSAVARTEGRRKGNWLTLPGVEPIDAFKPAATPEEGTKRMVATPRVKKASQTGSSLIKPKEDTKERIDQIGAEIGARIGNDTLSRLCDDYYRLRQIGTLLAPYYSQLGVEMNGDGEGLDAPQLAVETLVDLLQQAGEDAEGKVDENKKPFTPFGYLKSLLISKRKFLAAYGKRHEGKDYTKLSLTQLKRTKTPEAAAERFRRGVNATIAYNDAASIPEQRWFINAAAVVELVEGRPGAAKDYIENGDRAEEIKAHHAKYNLHPGDNRKSTKITDRITVPDLPAGAAPETEEVAETEESEEVVTAAEE